MPLPTALSMQAPTPVGPQRYRTNSSCFRGQRPGAEQQAARTSSTSRGQHHQRIIRKKPSRACSAPMAGARCGGTASRLSALPRDSFMKRSVWPGDVVPVRRRDEGKEIARAGDAPSARRHRASMPVGEQGVSAWSAPITGPKMRVTLPTPENHARALRTICGRSSHRQPIRLVAPIVRLVGLWRPGKSQDG